MSSETKTIELKDGMLVASGYGLKIYVERGHLMVHQGVGRDRSTARLNRATSRLKRLFIVGHTGFVTLEAMRWIRDVGAAFVQVDADSTIVAMSVAESQSSARHLRRAQVLAAESDEGLRLLAGMLQKKVRGQAQLAGRLVDYRAERAGRDRRTADVQGSILERLRDLEQASSIKEMRLAESIAARLYWQAWANLPIQFERAWQGDVPEHWRTAGPRTSRMDRKRAKRALTPAHAILNYLYAILECEATIAAQRMGFDPTLGLMHTDKRYRPSLASDLMEPARITADGWALDLIETHAFERGEVFETRQGVCRLAPDLTKSLANSAPILRDSVAPHAEALARSLLTDDHHPTPLTRRRHREALNASFETAARNS